MNNINFMQANGFPLDCDVLSFMQDSWRIFNQLGHMAGQLAIIKGCEPEGSSIKDGFVFVNGEVLPFKGGLLGERVIIKQNEKTLIFEDLQAKPTLFERYACFGINPAEQWLWADFKPIKNQQEQDQNIEKLSQRLDNVEKALPIGLVAIWDKPAAQIPLGWVEHTELAGKVPAGKLQAGYQNTALQTLAGGTKFWQAGAELGSYTHQLSEAEMPKHVHEYDRAKNYGSASGNAVGHPDLGFDKYLTGAAGGDQNGHTQAHNNIQPTRIVRFIRFVGFETQID
jgi:hypothetical protein